MKCIERNKYETCINPNEIYYRGCTDKCRFWTNTSKPIKDSSMKEQIIIILKNYMDMEWSECANEIMALFAEAMPTDEEIDNHFNTSPDNHIHPDRYRAEGAKWFRNRMKGGKK